MYRQTDRELRKNYTGRKKMCRKIKRGNLNARSLSLKLKTLSIQSKTNTQECPKHPQHQQQQNVPSKVQQETSQRQKNYPHPEQQQQQQQQSQQQQQQSPQQQQQQQSQQQKQQQHPPRFKRSKSLKREMDEEEFVAQRPTLFDDLNDAMDSFMSEMDDVYPSYFTKLRSFFNNQY